MKTFYTIFLGDELWKNVIDDMNSTEIWAEGGMLWGDEKKAIACMERLKRYDFETENKKFRVVKMKVYVNGGD